MDQTRAIAPTRERDITRAIAREYFRQFDEMIESDALIIGVLLMTNSFAWIGDFATSWFGSSV